MKKILWLLLLLPGIAAGQIYIDSYKFAAPAGRAAILDDHPADAAYSLYKLRSAYTGNCMQIMKDVSGGQDTLDIGFVDGYADTVAIKNHCGTNSGDTCYVRRWYDQSGNSKTISQTSIIRMPTIGGRVSNNPGLNRFSNDIGIYFFQDDGGSAQDFMEAADNTYWQFLHESTHSVFTVASAGESADPEAGYAIWGTTLTSVGRGAALLHDTRNSLSRDDILIHLVYNGTGGTVAQNFQNANTTFANQQFLNTLIAKPTDATASERSALGTDGGSFQKNNTQTATRATGTPWHTLFLGTFEDSSNTKILFLRGFYFELIFYKSDKTSDRTTIETNINTAYSIY